MHSGFWFWVRGLGVSRGQGRARPLLSVRAEESSAQAGGLPLRAAIGHGMPQVVLKILLVGPVISGMSSKIRRFSVFLISDASVKLTEQVIATRFSIIMILLWAMARLSSMKRGGRDRGDSDQLL